jgi:hypothetical protein
MISCGFLLEGTIMTRHLGLAVARPLSISAGHNSKAGWRKKTMRIWKGCDLLGSMIVRRGFTLTCSECGPKMQSLGKVEGKKKQKLLSALFAQQCHFVITHWLTFGGKMFFVLEGLLQAHVHQDARM